MRIKCPDCCYPEVVDTDACGCCEGVEIVTPLPTANRPGLSKLAYRIGTHASFLETMMARLSSSDFPRLSGLTTRDPADPSIALLDAWATVADVLTFYQERIINEGYLPTATERRSILELARLVGYKLRPGVASSVFLAYTIDEKMEDEVTIPAGTRTQSIPGPDELPQTFETSEDLKARAQWNNLKPRMTQPQTQVTIFNENEFRVYLKGINTNIEPNDPLLIGIGETTPGFYRVNEIITDANVDRTLVKFRFPSDVVTATENPKESLVSTVQLIKDLTLRPSLQPRNTWRLRRKLADQFSTKAGAGYRTVSSFSPLIRESLPLAATNARVTTESELKVYALRVEASLFGHNAPREPQYEPATHIPNGSEFPVTNPNAGNLKSQPWDEWKPDGESTNVLHLDCAYDQIFPDTYVVVQKSDEPEEVFVSKSVQVISRSAYGMSGETTKIILNDGDDWWDCNLEGDISEIRTTKIYAQPERLKLAEEPIQDPIGQCESDIDAESENNRPIELDGFYEGLESGRRVIVSGEREIEGTSGVRSSELAMLASVTHGVSMIKDENGNITDEPLPDDKTHTFIDLAEKLKYCFKRDTVTINGNVAKATHGETRHEVLGSGDGSKALQSFELKQFPLTHVAAANPTGVDSTIKVIVNDMQWHEVDSLAGLETTDRNFITETDDEDRTTITFGNGKEGARLPTGVENIRAEYRNGIGKPGNVKADQISLLMDKPLGVKEVINPDRASGGADRESRDLARKNAPLAVKALDRLVSVQDYEDFARTYAGIGKARAVEITDGRRQIVHVTIAGADDIPIDETSDLFRNLRRALHDFGDPFQPVQLAVRELMLMVISARVRLMPDYQWEPVVVRVREALLDAFGFEARELGQDVLLSEVISVMQSVRGVAYVDVDSFGGIPEKINDFGARRLLTPDEISMFIDCLSMQWKDEDKQKFLTVDEISEYVKCTSIQWPALVENMDNWCVSFRDSGDKNEEICKKFDACKSIFDRQVEKTTRVRQRLGVNLADLESDVIRPAQIAFLNSDVPETIILNQIE